MPVPRTKIFPVPLPHPGPTPRRSKTAEFVPSSGEEAAQLPLFIHCLYFPSPLERTVSILYRRTLRLVLNSGLPALDGEPLSI